MTLHGLQSYLAPARHEFGSHHGRLGGFSRHGQIPAAFFHTPVNGQAVLGQRLASSLQNSIQARPAQPATALTDSEFTPEKVAERILASIQDRIDSARAAGASEEELAGLMEQARTGVETGLKQSRAILDNLGLLQGTIAENVDATEALLQQGLDRIADALLPATNEPVPALSGATAEPAVSAFQQVLQARSRSLDLQIQTSDGDVVTISLSAYQGRQQTEALTANNQTVALSTREVRVAGSSLFYSVQGELDNNELAAIDKLVGDVSNLADKFFDGHVRAGLRQAGQLSFNADELAGFTLSLRQTDLSRVSSAYQAVAQLGESETAETPQPVQGLAGFVGQLDSMLSNEKLPDAAQQLKQLFSELGGYLDDEAASDSQPVDQLVDNLAADHDTAAPEQEQQDA